MSPEFLLHPRLTMLDKTRCKAILHFVQISADTAPHRIRSLDAAGFVNWVREIVVSRPIDDGSDHAALACLSADPSGFRPAPFPGPEAAALRYWRNVGHSMWLGAGQAAACRKPSRMVVSLRIVRSSSYALAMSIRRSMRGRPSGANIRAISSREKPASRPRAISASRSRTAGPNSRRWPRLPIDAIRPRSS